MNNEIKGKFELPTDEAIRAYVVGLEQDEKDKTIEDIYKTYQMKYDLIKPALMYFMGPVKKADDLQLYAKTIVAELNNFLEGQDLYVTAAIYPNGEQNQIATIKLEFSDTPKEIRFVSSVEWLEPFTEDVRNKVVANYYTGNNICIIRPNQDIFWTKNAAVEDAREIIIDILNEGRNETAN